MAHSGPPGKGIKHGRTPNADWTEVVDVPYDGPSPDLPKPEGRRRWAVAVVEWWEDVRRMPHCVLWGPTDWRFAIETAYLKAAFWNDYKDGEVKATLATEIRRREDQLGTTREALRQLRIRYVDLADLADDEETDEPGTALAVVEEQEQADPGVAGVTPLASRRRRLTA